MLKRTTEATMCFQIKPRNIENLQIWTKTKWNQCETTVEQSKMLFPQNQFLN